MDFNLVVLTGRLASPPELRTFESGARLIRYLVTVTSEAPQRRIDVLPVTLWDPDDELLSLDPQPGQSVHFIGNIQRRFWDGAAGRRSRIEIVACNVSFRGPEDLVPEPAEV